MKTIKQIADEIGVSKTAVSKQITKLGLREYVQSFGNRFALPDNIAELLKLSFSQTKTQRESQTIANQIEPNELALTTLSKHLEHLSDALAREQALHADTKNQYRALLEAPAPASTPRKLTWRERFRGWTV